MERQKLSSNQYEKAKSARPSIVFDQNTESLNHSIPTATGVRVTVVNCLHDAVKGGKRSLTEGREYRDSPKEGSNELLFLLCFITAFKRPSMVRFCLQVCECILH